MRHVSFSPVLRRAAGLVESAALFLAVIALEGPGWCASGVPPAPRSVFGSTYTVDKAVLWLAALFSLASMVGSLLLYLNVRRRRTLESSLRQTEAKFRQVFNSVDDAIFIHAPDGTLLEVNRAACERLGKTRDEMLRLTVADLVAAEVRGELSGRIARICRDRAALFESLHLTRGEQFLPVEVSGRLVDYQGAPAVLCVARDITRRKLDEEEMHLQAELLEREIAEHQRVEEALRVERNNLLIVPDRSVELAFEQKLLRTIK